MTAAATDNIINTYGNRDDFDYIKINTGNIIIIDFNMSDNTRNMLIDSGYTQTMEYLTKESVKKKQYLIEDYELISKILISLMDFIKSDNIERSKLLLGDLFIFLVEVKDIISISTYQKIINLKDEFIPASKGRSWFGKPRFKDKKKLLKTLTKAIFDVNSRINNLKLSLAKLELLQP